MIQPNNTIQRFDIERNTDQSIQMPEGAIILSFNIEQGQPHLFALTNPLNQFEQVYIDLFSTNSPYECKGGKHELIGSAFDWHAFQRVSDW